MIDRRSFLVFSIAAGTALLLRPAHFGKDDWVVYRFEKPNSDNYVQGTGPYGDVAEMRAYFPSYKLIYVRAHD